MARHRQVALPLSCLELVWRSDHRQWAVLRALHQPGYRLLFRLLRGPEQEERMASGMRPSIRLARHLLAIVRSTPTLGIPRASAGRHRFHCKLQSRPRTRRLDVLEWLSG